MNTQIQQALDLINDIFVANGAQEITGENSNAVLQKIVYSIYSLTGDNTDLETVAKDSLVEAINEVNGLVNQLNSIKLYTGTEDPNVTPPNGGNFNTLDFYMRQQNVGGNMVNIDLFINTSIPGVNWLSLLNKDNIFVSTLPTTGDSTKLYIRTSDNTLWRFVSGLGVWAQLGVGGYREWTVQGNVFQLRKKTGNVGAGLQVGDFLLNGCRTDVTPNKFITLMQVQSLPGDTFLNYVIFNDFDI